MEEKKFIIIDAMALAYKGYFAFINRPLKTSSGETTSAIFGFLNQLFKIIEDTNPDYIAVATDSKEKTFRHEMYDLYKSSRAQMPDDMIPQIQKIYEIIEAFKIPLYKMPGYEADDLIGTAVKKAAKLGYDCYAITPDKDYIQLIDPNVKMIKPGKSTDEIMIIDEQKVKEDYGFEPKQMIDYLALVGDSSDDIPGVAGIGPKSATPLIKEFNTVEEIYENIDKIEKTGIKKKLEANKENAFLSKKLATILTDVPFELELEKAKFGSPDIGKLKNIFNELEFNNFGSKLVKLFDDGNNTEQSVIKEETKEDSFDKNNVKYTLIKSEEEAEKLAGKLFESGLFVFDTETDSLDVYNINLAGVAFSFQEGEAYFVAINPFRVNVNLFEKDISDRLSIDLFIKIFKPLFEDKNIKKVCQNGKYDIGVLKHYKVNLQGFYFDTMLASYIIDPDEKHGMDALSEKYLNHTPVPISTLIGAKKEASKIFEADLTELSYYSCEDADITYRLYRVFEKMLIEEKLDKLAMDIEFPLVLVLEQMERTGIKLDTKSLNLFSDELQILLDNYTKVIYDLAGETFNINSTKQLQRILFEKLNLPAVKKTKTGYSTNAASLEAIRGQHEIIDTLLNYRQVSKLKSTYADALPSLINSKTGRLHTTYNQTVASTGRLSSLNPNLQNIPIRTELGREIRKAFIPSDKNYIILSADYSQIELRIMASICADEGLISAFNNREDIHRSTAALVFQVEPEDVTPDMRRKAKEVNFGILYGIGAFGLSNRLGISNKHAREIIDTYFSTFKRVKNYMEDSIKLAKENGYAETLLGRRRFLRNINSSNRVVRQFEERVAINMPIQGTAADMIKIAMINIHNELYKLKAGTKMVLQVHDELVFDVRKDELENLKPMIIEKMETALPLNVPVLVECGTGNNWLDAH